MKKFLFLSLYLLLSFCQVEGKEDVIGFWKTIDENTGKARSIVAIYEYQGKYFGRIVATYYDNGKIKDSIYHPNERAPGVIGNPYYAGLDIIWDLQNKGGKYVNGHVIDPQKGKIYGAEMWLKNGRLIMRGKLLIFGRNQTWIAVNDSEFNEDFKKPDLRTFVPVIPKVK